MKNMTTVSIVTNTKTHHYTFSTQIKILFGCFLIVCFISFVLSIMLFIVTKNKLAVVSLNEQSLYQENIKLIQKNVSLSDKVAKSAQELSKLGKIEKILNLQPFNKVNIENVSNSKRLNVAVYEALERKYMLESIPNGYPTKTKYITSSFGWRFHPIKGVYHMHRGIDFGTIMGTNVYSTASGVIEYASYDNSGLGKLVKIRHPFGFTSYYGHLNKITAKVGDFVFKGSFIGETGNSGRSSGPHLHYGIKYINQTLDPSSFIRWNIHNYENIFTFFPTIKWSMLKKVVRKGITDKKGTDVFLNLDSSIL